MYVDGGRVMLDLTTLGWVLPLLTVGWSAEMERTHLLALLFHCDAYRVYKYPTTASPAYHHVAKTALWTGG